MEEVKCGKCDNGTQHYDDDGLMVSDTCYHCGGSGRIDPRLDFEDKLMSAAMCMAIKHIAEYIAIRNENPDGEDFEFMAAENQCSVHDYEQMLVIDAQYEFMEAIERLSEGEQMKLVHKLVKNEKIEPIELGCNLRNCECEKFHKRS